MIFYDTYPNINSNTQDRINRLQSSIELFIFTESLQIQLIIANLEKKIRFYSF